ncbi:MAG TPA: competence protein CoiA family protein [Bacillota bacterium]|nr:competence protein CoiA family protein [Bacillota bacterium]
MLCALTKDGETICLPSYTRGELQRLRSSTTFYCPTCQEPLLMKIGTEITPHFSHQALSSCTGGGEGEIHERGKWLLYSWLKNQYSNVSLEKYLPEIGQRPDVLLTVESKKFAIEFQYSTVSVNEIRKRNKMYTGIGITPIWFLDRRHLQQYGRHLFMINSFLKQFICQPTIESSPMLFFLCTEQSQIISLQQIIFSAMTKVFAHKYIWSLKGTTWIDVFQFQRISRKIFINEWHQEKKKFRMRPRYGVGKQKEWLQWLYEQRLSLDFLPSLIHLPVKGQMFMNVPPWNWQSRLWHFIQYTVPENCLFTIKDCQDILATFIHPPSYFPLLEQSIDPVTSYLHWLEILGYVKSKGDQSYLLHKTMPPYSHVEEALEQDNELMQSLKTLLLTSDRQRLRK